MSRRLRIEEEKARHLKDELQEEEDKMKLLQQKIFAPLLWRRFQNGIRVEDLAENHFEEVVQMILGSYLQEDILFRNTQMREDPVSQKCFGERLIFKMKDRASIVAVDEEKGNKVVGVLVLTPVTKCDYGRVYSRASLVEGKSYRAVTNFINHLNRKIDIFDVCQCEIYLRYYLLCVDTEYRHKGLGCQLMMVGVDIARHLNIPIITGIFNNHILQKIAKRIGMNQVLLEYSYPLWVDKDGELVFCDPGQGNYTCNIQAGIVPPPPIAQPPTILEPEPKRTRAEKRSKDKKGK